jgi:hypothetical protein
METTLKRRYQPPTGLFYFMYNCGRAVTFSYEFGNTDEMIKEAVDIFKKWLDYRVLIVDKDNIREKTDEAFLLDGDYNPNHGYTLLIVTTPTEKVTDDGPMCINHWNYTTVYGLKVLTDEEFSLIEDEYDYDQYRWIHASDESIEEFIFHGIILYDLQKKLEDTEDVDKPYKRERMMT